MLVPICASGTTPAEVAERAAQLCEERGFRPHGYHPVLDRGMTVIAKGGEPILQRTGVAIVAVLDDIEDRQHSHGKWWPLSEVYDYIEYCSSDEKEQRLAYIPECIPGRARKRMFGWNHLLRWHWPLE